MLSLWIEIKIQNRIIMKNRIGLLVLFLSMLWLASCHHCDTNYDISQVKYGTSFGECFGYCAHDLTLEEGTSDSYHHWYGGAPDRHCTESYDNWSSLTESIDFEAFKELPEVIGCPDCADGGAEWIEITADGETHRVTFEYHNDPETVENYIGELRNQMEVMKDICL